MAVLLGSISSERVSRYLDSHLKSFIDSLNERQLIRMKRNLGSEMRLTNAKKDKQRFQMLKYEMQYVNYRLGK